MSTDKEKLIFLYVGAEKGVPGSEEPGRQLMMHRSQRKISLVRAGR